MFKMSAFCTDTHCQSTSPLIISRINNVLLQIFPFGFHAVNRCCRSSHVFWTRCWYDVINTC